MDLPQDGPDAQHGQRLLILWACWVLLAAFLVVAGVVAFG